MTILTNHLSEKCDPRLQGVLSFGIKEAYRFLDEFVQRENFLQLPEMKQTWGYLRHGLVDVGLKQVLQSSKIEHEIVDKTSSRYANGHTYLMIETKGAIITPAKVYAEQTVPKKAIYRSQGSVLNKNYNLFEEPADLNESYNKNDTPFLLLTYGGRNHMLDFVNLALPDLGVQQWIDRVNITNSPILLANEKEISNELQLTFTSKAESILRGVENGEEGAI